MYIKKYAKKCAAILACVMTVASVAACGGQTGDNKQDASSEVSYEAITSSDQATEEKSEEAVTGDNKYEVPEGMYLSETTGEPISEDIKDQRPIAVMVDNEKTALPHYGTAEADVVYELMNSTKNDRITRFMCIMKDWGSIQQMGSIRSTRPTNILLASEWNAILCHDGGPYHNDAYFAKDWARDHLSGVFSRVDNGKKREFTEYIIEGDLDTQLGKYNISPTYNEYANEGSHFNFVEYGQHVDLDVKYSRTYEVNKVTLPFWHNGSNLVFNDHGNKYEYYEYGEQHLDAEDDEPLAFKNVILQKCSFTQLDENGYLIYNCIAAGQPGWYLTNGYAKDITWTKDSETGVTKYYDENGDELQINTGKTYIALIPEDSWDKVVFE